MANVLDIRRQEWPIVVGFALPAGAVWIFVELADEVFEGSTAAFDRAVLLVLRAESDPSDPLGPAWFEELMRDFTALGGIGVLTLITLAAAGFLLVIRKPRAAAAVLVAVGGGIALSSAMKLGFNRPRPDVVAHGAPVSSASFPSGHSMMAAVVYLTLAVMLARVRPHWRVRSYILGVAVLATVLVGVSRIYLGVHWPTDVLAGWVVGAGWALLCWSITLLLQRRGRLEGDAATG